MKNLFLGSKYNYKELLYQLLIISVLFIFFSYSQDLGNVTLSSLIAVHKFAFFGNYMIAAMLINYVLLPDFYYNRKKYLFFVMLITLIIGVILIDEYVLEQIYFPTTRGVYFPGIFFTLLETLPIIIIMVAFKLAWDSNKKESEIDNLKALVKESELQFLKNQINPHFLFNNLNNLYAHALENSPKTPDIILELSSVLRYLLYDCKEDFVPLSKEIKHLENYTALHELQILQRGKISFRQKIASPSFYISPLVLVVFVENAFKHSIGSQVKNITIDIEVTVSQNGLLHLCCHNNFLPDNKSNEHSGIGLENVKKRLKLLYPKKHDLAISVDKNIYKVDLSMQLKPSGQC